MRTGRGPLPPSRLFSSSEYSSVVKGGSSSLNSGSILNSAFMDVPSFLPTGSSILSVPVAFGFTLPTSSSERPFELRGHSHRVVEADHARDRRLTGSRVSRQELHQVRHARIFHDLQLRQHPRLPGIDQCQGVPGRRVIRARAMGFQLQFAGTPQLSTRSDIPCAIVRGKRQRPSP